MAARGRPLTYDAFLSYSHADAGVAEAVQKGLHRIGRRVGQLRALRVYRDATDLAANPGFWIKLEEALLDARNFVAVLSPAAARSEWVDKEIATWVERNGVERVLIVLAAGELVWDPERRRFDPQRSTAVPDALASPGLFAFEPLWVDLRDFGASELSDLSPGPLRSKLVDLAAPIHERPKEELDSEDRRELRRFRRYRRLAVAGLVLLAITSAAAAVIATQQRDNARRQARIASARELAARSIVAEDPDHALALALAAETATTPPLPEARSAFAAAGHRYLQLPAVPAGPAYRHHTGDVGAVAVSAAGRIASGAVDGTVAVWTAEDPPEQVQTLTTLDAGIVGLAWSPDGVDLVATTDGGDALVLDPDTGRTRSRANIGSPTIGALAFHPEATVVALAGDDGAVALWNRSDPPRIIVDGTGESGVVRPAIAWSLDGENLLHAGADGAAMVRDLSGQPVASLDAQVGDVRAVAWSHGRIAVGGTAGVVELFDIETYEFRDAVDHRGDWVDTLAFSPGGDVLVAGGHDSAIRFFDPATGRAVGEPLTSHSGWINAVAWSATKLVSASTDRSVRVWHRTGAAERNELFPSGAGDEALVRPVGWSPDGRRLAGGLTDGSIRIWNTDDGTEVHQLDGHSVAVSALDWSPDGRWLASGDEDGGVIIWETERMQVVGRSAVHTDWVSALDWNGTSDRVVTVSVDGTIAVVDSDGEGDAVTAGGTGIGGVAWLPGSDGFIVGDDDGRVRAPWAADPSEPLFIDPEHSVNAVAVSPAGQIAVALTDSSVVVIDREGSLLYRSVGHNAEILAVDWSPTGDVLASSSADATIRLWDAATGRAIGPPLRQADWNADAVTVRWSPDGHRLATTLLLGSAQVWSSLTEAAACDAVARSLTGQELTQLWGGIEPCSGALQRQQLAPLPVAP